MIKKIICTMLTVVTLFGTSLNVFASELTNEETLFEVLEDVEIDAKLDEIDLTKPYSETYHFTDEAGIDIIIDLKFTPEIQTRGSTTNKASAGTWTSSVNYGIISMSYKFDVAKTGSQWKISNARSHAYSGLFCQFSGAKLKVSRGTSTNSYPAELNASVNAKVFDNSWVPLYSGTWLMTTTINSGGTMKLTWN